VTTLVQASSTNEEIITTKSTIEVSNAEGPIIEANVFCYMTHKQDCHADDSRRTDARTMVAGSSVTWTHCNVRYEVTWGKMLTSAPPCPSPSPSIPLVPPRSPYADGLMRLHGWAASARKWHERSKKNELFFFLFFFCFFW
jgi:hypothetical protein